MKYMLTFKTDAAPTPGKSACKVHLPEMAALHDRLKRDGVLLTNEGLLPSDSGARVTWAGEKLAVLDGPFAEAKEVVAGFAIVNVPSKAVAVELAGQFLKIAGEGRCEILAVFEPPTA